MIYAACEKRAIQKKGEQRKQCAGETAIGLLIELLATVGMTPEVRATVDRLLTLASISFEELAQIIDRLVRNQFGRRSEKKSKAALAELLAGGGPDIPKPVADEYAGGGHGPDPDPGPGPGPGPRPGPGPEHGPKPEDNEKEKAKSKRPRKPRRSAGRNSTIHADIPRVVRIIDLNDLQKVCSRCNATKVRVGSGTTEQLRYVPSRLEVEQIVYPKYACANCRSDGVVSAPRENRPTIGDGLATFGLLAHIVVSKYVDHLPLYRQHKIFARQGLPLAESTMGKWVADTADALKPIAQAIGANALEAHVLQTDDTGLRVLDPSRKDGSAKGHLWGYLGDDKWFYYRYTPNWKADDPQEFLQGRRGWLVADGYAGYEKLYKSGEAGCVEVGCWAHTRRYFERASLQENRAAVALHYIAKLYAIEGDGKERSLDAKAMVEMRMAQAPPILGQLKAWIDSLDGRVTPKSALGKAINYLRGRWRALQRYLEDGALPIDNTGIERAHRPTAVGRRNWLFAGNHAAAERTAVLYTVVNTCAYCGIDPELYIADTLMSLQQRGSAARLAELLPPAWSARKQAE